MTILKLRDIKEMYYEGLYSSNYADVILYNRIIPTICSLEDVAYYAASNTQVTGVLAVAFVIDPIKVKMGKKKRDIYKQPQPYTKVKVFEFVLEI